MRHVAHFGQRMNPDPKQKRERFQQLTQNPKVKSGKVFAADLRKSKIHPTVKKLTAWRKLNRLSQRKAVAVLAQYYFHLTFPSLRSWEEGRRSPNSHTAAILEKFLLDRPTVERPKDEPTPQAQSSHQWPHLTAIGSTAIVKQHMAAIPMLFSGLTEVLAVNPVRNVKS